MDIKEAQALYNETSNKEGRTESLGGFDYILYYMNKAKIDFCVKHSIKNLESKYEFYIYNPTAATVRVLKVISKDYRNLGYGSSVTTNTFVFSEKVSKVQFSVWGWQNQ